MSYLHCHKCRWSQDDWWHWKPRRRGSWWILPYNPVSFFLSLLFTHWKWSLLRPHRIEHDRWVMKDYGWSRRDPHSWWLILWNFKMMIQTFRCQKWWSYKAWDSDRKLHRAFCPKCGSPDYFDID
jgi:hypothetical protein